MIITVKSRGRLDPKDKLDTRPPLRNSGFNKYKQSKEINERSAKKYRDRDRDRQDRTAVNRLWKQNWTLYTATGTGQQQARTGSELPVFAKARLVVSGGCFAGSYMGYQ